MTVAAQHLEALVGLAYRRDGLVATLATLEHAIDWTIARAIADGVDEAAIAEAAGVSAARVAQAVARLAEETAR